ncbi:hypothetical protein [Saccharothrix stipae]
MPATVEDYLDALAPLVARLVGAVHDEGPDDITGALIACRALPAPHQIDPQAAIPIMLAAMVDPDKRPSELLAWTGQLVGRTTGDTAAANPLAVEMTLAGHLPAHALNRAEIDEAVDELLRRGWTQDDIRDHLQAEPRDADAWVRASRARTKRAKQAA